jgi:hypothetical protein
VGDEHGGEPEAAVHLVQLGADVTAQAGIEVAERLVEQDQFRSGHESTGERNPLLLPPGQLRRVAIEQRGAVDHRRGLLHPAFADPRLDPPRPQRVADVLADGHVRPQRVRLEDHADLALVGRPVDPPFGIEDDLVAERDPTGARRLQAGEAAQRGRLAAPARTEEDEELALLDLDVQVVHGLGRGLADEVLRQPTDVYA